MIRITILNLLSVAITTSFFNIFFISLYYFCYYFFSFNFLLIVSLLDDNILSDPYCVIHLAGETMKTKRHDETTFPQWYESLALDVELPENINLAPSISILVYDYDQFSAGRRERERSEEERKRGVRERREY